MTEPDMPNAARIRSALLAKVDQRGPKASLCPSEVARALAPGDWRMLMPAVRAVARELAIQGRLEITQAGQPVPAQGPWKGPIRLRLPRPGTPAAQPPKN